MNIKREKKNNVFNYYNIKTNKKIINTCTLEYIDLIKIPPAWNDVKISINKNSKVLAEGKDSKKRIQKIYNKQQQLDRQKKYFCLLKSFVKELPKLYNDIDKNLEKKRINKEVLISLVIKIIMHCNFRVGNIKYLKDNDSYGITTIKRNHIKIKNDNNIEIDFIGKKQVRNKCNINDNNIYELLKKLYNNKDNNESIFFYKNINITSIDINNFLKTYNNKITAKMFRTLKANITLINEIEKYPINKNINNRKKLIRDIVKKVAIDLHHTPSICSKSYIILKLKELYINNPIIYRKIIKKNYINKGKYNKADYALLSFLDYYC